jgi:hypothetical protein
MGRFIRRWAVALVALCAASSALAQFPPPPGGFPAPPPPAPAAPPEDTPAAPAPGAPKGAPRASGGPAITGVWAGPMKQVEGTTEYTIKVSITGRGLDTEYPELNCTGKLTRIGQSKSYAFFVEIIANGRTDKGGRCPDGSIVMARNGDDLVLSWFGAIQGHTVIAYGTLKKQKP